MIKILLILLMVVPCYARQVSRLDNRLMLLWHLNENTGVTVADVSGKGNTGTMVGSVTWVTGKYSAGNHIIYNEACGIYNTSFQMKSASGTICFWFRSSEGVAETLFYFDGGWANGFLWYEGQVGWTSNRITSGNASITRDGNWHFWAITYETTAGLIMYKDGVFLESRATLAPGTTTTGFYLGCRNTTGNTGTRGDFDDVAVYNTNLSANEIKNIYRNNRKPND